MRILVTGGHGQVTRCIDRANTQHTLVFLTRPHIDLAHPQTVYDAVCRATPDLILSCAAMSSVDACEADEGAAFAVNARSPGELARAAAVLDVPIIHLSTDYVFGGRQNTPYLEADLPDPINAYGRSKLAGEQAVAEVHRHVVVRPTWIYSPFGGFVKGAADAASAGLPIRAVADQIACPTSGLDLARVLLAMADRLARADDAKFYGVFHGAGALAASRGEVVRAALPQVNVIDVPARDFFNGAPRPLYSVLDSSKLTRTYGLRLRGWPEALGEAF